MLFIHASAAVSAYNSKTVDRSVIIKTTRDNEERSLCVFLANAVTIQYNENDSFCKA